MMSHLRSPKRAFSLASILIIIFLGGIIYYFTRWPLYLIWLVTLSLITFVLYGYDKGQAKLNRPRVPEVVLHGLALFGGFPGGWVGRGLFRHKTQKSVFTVILIISTVLHIVGLGWWFIGT